MKQAIVIELPYQPDSSATFNRIRDLGDAIWLDSSHPFSATGRFDIITAKPIKKITTSHLKTNSYSENLNVFESLGNILNDSLSPLQPEPNLPFVAGAIGYFSYDAARQFVRLPELALDDIAAPIAITALYDCSIIVDHQQKRSVLAAHPESSTAKRELFQQKLQTTTVNPRPESFRLQGEIHSNLSQPAYYEAFERIMDYIRAGDCYQVNLAQRFSAKFSGDPFDAYRRLRQTAAAPYSAYLDFQETQILSLSPEQFLTLDGKQVRTCPIKGTRGRAADPHHDRQLANSLAGNPKDRAENLMIVDLLRNDLGKTCVAGSIHVPKLFELQSFATVHHLVSTIEGLLRDDRNALQLLASCFPGGSITGAPKQRAMEIIEELEPHRRSIYCGTIAYIGCDGNMDSNITIRTLICDQGQIHCWGGGGIVADSDCASEYAESITKVKKLLEKLETL